MNIKADCNPSSVNHHHKDGKEDESTLSSATNRGATSNLKPRIIILMNSFPYGKAEPYMETEIEYIPHVFEQVALVALNVKQHPGKDETIAQCETVREIPDGIDLVTIPLKSAVEYLAYGFACLIDANFYRELISLVRERRLSIGTLAILGKYVSRSHHECRVLVRQLNHLDWFNPVDEQLVYTYRFEYTPYVALLLKRFFPNLRIVARAHRYDLYEEWAPFGYLPMRDVLFRELERVYPCSQHGVEYIMHKYNSQAAQVRLARLGTKDYGVAEHGCRDHALRIVSCSNIVEVKRVELIVAALALVDGFNIEWTHFGDGALAGYVQTLARDVLPANVSVRFEGAVTNTEVLHRYSRGGFHLFVNVSSSEGVPVSIMEALSFGIPCIATDVGGTGEILQDGRNGFLLPANFEFEDLAIVIERVANMAERDYRKLRCAARVSWEEKCSADAVYPMFLEELRDFIYARELDN